MCVAQGVSPGIVNPPSNAPPPCTAASGGTRRREGLVSCGPRADALGDTHAAPLGLLRLFIKNRKVVLDTQTS